MRRLMLLAVTAAALAGCGPSPEPATSGAQEPLVDVSRSAAEFDVGPIMSAAGYLDEVEYADADFERGELLSLACVACHTLEAGQDHMLGPNLSGIFGVPAGQKSGFEYSQALANTGLIWTPRALDAWLAAPASFVPGTSMIFAGYAQAEDRHNLIAHLLRVTQSPDP